MELPVPQMRKPALLALVLTLIVLFPCLPSLAAQPVRVGVYNTAPMSFMENGQATGFTIDLLKDLAERERWELVFVPGTWNECLSRLRSGEIDLLPNISQTREREQEFRFSREYLILDWVRVYRKQGADIHTLFDLEGTTITALKSSNFTEDLQTLLDQFGIRATIVTKPEYAEVLAAVARGEADAGICPGILGSLLEQTYAVRPTDIIFSPTKIRCAVKIGGRGALLSALDRHLADLKARPGSLYYQLRQKWLGIGGEPMLPGWAHWAIGLGLAALGLLAAFVLFLRLLVKRRTAELAASEQRFRTLADNGQALIWTSTPDKLCNYFNGPWLAFTGRRLEQELGNGWAEGVHPDDFARCLEIYVAAFDSRESFSMEYRLRHASGEYRWIVDQGTPRYDSQGEFLGYIGHCLDITDLKRTEDALRETTALTESILNAIPSPIFIKNRAGAYIGGNAALSAFLGRPKEEYLGKGVFELYTEEDARKYFDMDEALMAADGVQTYDYRLTNKNGETREVLFSKAATHDVAGKVNGIVGVVTDITERIRAEEELIKARDAAEAANRAKSEFLANMSHELRTPMNGVLGMLQLLMMEELSAGQQMYTHKAFESAHRLLSLLNDVLDFSRIEAGVLAFRQEPFQVGDILAATTDVFGHICARKGLALHIKADPGLPAAMLGDEARIRQIVFNLVGNAVKFTMQGEVSVEAWHRDRQGQRPGTLYITVADTGVGIPEAKLDSVFDRFSQADSSYTRSFEGAGLGLAIVRRIVEALGGSLCIDSEVGQGTAVTLALPAPVAQPEAMGRPRDAAASTEEAMPLRILLAEDELIGQMGARVMLERMGHTVVAVSDGRAAVEAVLTGNFDCVLMDIQMPEMDGLEATRIIRGHSAPEKGRVPIVAMTAYALSGDREKFLAAGMDEYIAKPFEREELRLVLQAVGHSLRQGARR